MRNVALVRLGARIKDLEEEGYVFHPHWRGGDYVYTNGPKRQPTCAEVLEANREVVAAFDKSTLHASLYSPFVFHLLH
jgi:hypothetical protein